MLAEDQDQQHTEAHVPDPRIIATLGKRDEDDDDALFEELEKELDNDFDMAGIRERRMAEMKREFERVRGMRDLDHGHYTEITDEKQVIETTAKESACIVHFYHRDFDRCKIMDRHLEALAPRYFATRFIRVFVENVPWLVNKLQVQVLPFIGCFMDGVLKHRMVGFEELGNDDSFATAALEMRLSLIGVIQAAGPTVSKKRGKGRRKGSDSGDDGSDDD